MLSFSNAFDDFTIIELSDLGQTNTVPLSVVILTMGSSINISTDAGAQIASDVGKGVIQGVSQYVEKKMRAVKITLKAGHRLLLHSPEK